MLRFIPQHLDQCAAHITREIGLKIRIDNLVILYIIARNALIAFQLIICLLLRFVFNMLPQK